MMDKSLHTKEEARNLNDLNKNVAEFKKPRSLARKKPKILTEDKYIEEISKIIQRDFFPDLEKLRAQNEYLDAMEKKDYPKMQAIRSKYSGQKPIVQNNHFTPATFETPISSYNETPAHSNDVSNPELLTPDPHTLNTPKEITEGDSQKSISDSHSLDSFLQNYTSEDNYSFEEIIETANERLRQKFEVLYNEEKISSENLKRALILPSIEEQFNQSKEPRKIETWTYRNKNSIMYIPDGVELTRQEQMNSACHKQSIQHYATRLAVNPFDNFSSQNPKLNTEKNHTNTESGKVDCLGNIKESCGKAMPQIRGFELIKTPSPRPGEAFSPLMTWGEIEGTPFRLDGSDTPLCSSAGPSFKIAENSRRENIALELAEKVGQKMRAQKQRAKDTANKNIGSPFIRSNMERLASMSPAARRLATTTLGLRSQLMSPSPIRASYLPRKNKASARLEKLTPIKKDTNAFSKALTPITSRLAPVDNSTLTDDLLQIPTKRHKASDFF